MKSVVLSLGGSMIVPDKVDTKFLKNFRKLILDFTKKGNKAAMVCGGGRTCRIYQGAAKDLVGKKITDVDLDWVGIKSTRLNAELVRIMFGKDAHRVVIDNPEDPIKTNKKIIIGAGYSPGHSSDMDAVLLAHNIKANVMMNLTNVDYVYDKDPRKFKDAKPLKKLTWNKFLDIIGRRWVPGKNTPFDPIAAKKCMKFKMKVIIINGNDLGNIKNYLEGKKFKGTILG